MATTKVKITALPRQGYRGFGAIRRYFESGTPETIDVTDAELKELQEDPAKFFLKVEAPDEEVPAVVDPPAKKK